MVNNDRYFIISDITKHIPIIFRSCSMLSLRQRSTCVSSRVSTYGDVLGLEAVFLIISIKLAALKFHQMLIDGKSRLVDLFLIKLKPWV